MASFSNVWSLSKPGFSKKTVSVTFFIVTDFYENGRFKGLALRWASNARLFVSISHPAGIVR
jgi:hypothetical protein